jgi:hypothetical protein
MSGPDQFRNGGSGIQGVLNLLDSGLVAIQDRDPGRNDILYEFQTFYETINIIA